MNKNKFICLCGHKEDKHNFDPDSAFFGCCEKFYASSPLSDNVIPGEALTCCKCDEFRPDTLKYVEEACERKHTNKKTR